ncbi:hypothetical protein K3495_g15936 [Podosphaera aphanis]|nr:hypothetical protein K3495_g15936 [Podosphaera aphanis]
MKLDHPQVFTCLDDMLSWLASFFKDPNEKETARVAYRNCRMSSNETFNNFYSRFSELSSKARIDPGDVLSDLFHKLSPELYNLSISLMAKNPPLSVAIKRFQFYDNKLRLNRPVTNTTRPATKISDLNKPRFTLTGTSSPQEINNSRLTQGDTLHLRNTTVNPSSSNHNRPTPKCFGCQGYGHISTDCPTAKREQRSDSRALAQLEEMTEGAESEFEDLDSENDEP